MKVLVTGAAGFIGTHVTQSLLERGDTVIGVDNMNDYYDVSLKEARLAWIADNSNSHAFRFVKLDIADQLGMQTLFAEEQFEKDADILEYLESQQPIANE